MDAKSQSQIIDIPVLDTKIGVKLEGRRNSATDLGLFVKYIEPGGSAYTDGRLRINDKITTINEISLLHMANRDAMSTLKRAIPQKGLVTVTVTRRLRNLTPDGRTKAICTDLEHHSHEIGAEEITKNERKLRQFELEINNKESSNESWMDLSGLLSDLAGADPTDLLSHNVHFNDLGDLDQFLNTLPQETATADSRILCNKTERDGLRQPSTQKCQAPEERVGDSVADRNWLQDSSQDGIGLRTQNESFCTTSLICQTPVDSTTIYICNIHRCQEKFTLVDVKSGKAGRHIYDKHGMLPRQVKDCGHKFLKIKVRRAEAKYRGYSSTTQSGKLVMDADYAEVASEHFNSETPCKNVTPPSNRQRNFNSETPLVMRTYEDTFANLLQNLPERRKSKKPQRYAEERDSKAHEDKQFVEPMVFLEQKMDINEITPVLSHSRTPALPVPKEQTLPLKVKSAVIPSRTPVLPSSFSKTPVLPFPAPVLPLPVPVFPVPVPAKKAGLNLLPAPVPTKSKEQVLPSLANPVPLKPKAPSVDQLPAPVPVMSKTSVTNREALPLPVPTRERITAPTSRDPIPAPAAPEAKENKSCGYEYKGKPFWIWNKEDKKSNPSNKTVTEDVDGFEDFEDLKVVRALPRGKIGPLFQEKSQIEIKRDKIVAEREALFKEYLADIQRDSRAIIEENEKGKRKRCQTNKKSRKKANLDDDWQPRRSPRDSKQVNYYAPDDIDGSLENTKNVRRSERPRKKMNVFSGGPPSDEYIFCERCQEDKHHGCDVHPVRFMQKPDVEISMSKVAKGAGRGVFSRGTIKEGSLFGSYEGTYYTKSAHDQRKERLGESGYAWELRDEEKLKVVGVVDPGFNPDPEKHWMSMVNMSGKTRNENLVAVQYCGRIFYMAIKEILPGQELLVNYGDDYAEDLGIDLVEKDFFELEEFWEEEGVKCEHCSTGFSNQKFLDEHIQRTESEQGGGCPVLKKRNNYIDVLTGAKKHICDECSKGFKTRGELWAHNFCHNEEPQYPCDQCNKAYKRKHALTAHIQAKHLGVRFSCPKCPAQFNHKSNLNSHLKECNKEKEYKCDQCGRKFANLKNLNGHIVTVHKRQFEYACDECDERFSLKWRLTQHVKQKHREIRNYKCDDCDKGFFIKNYFEYHRRKYHTFDWSDWKYNCSVCEEKANGLEGFRDSGKLKIHMGREHPETLNKIENQFECPKCGKEFRSETEVDIHVNKIHNT